METKEPVECLLNRIADRWTVLVIDLLRGGTKRFNVIRREIDGISQKMLTQTLRNLERDGLVRRCVYAEVPPRVEYSLTPLGRTLCEPVTALRRWAETHHPEIMAARAGYAERAKEEQEVSFNSATAESRAASHRTTQPSAAAARGT